MPLSVADLSKGLPLNPLPPFHSPSASVPHVASRHCELSVKEKILSVKNALRYFPAELHEILAPEFAEELERYGHIYMYRFVPDIPMKAYPIDAYVAKSKQCAAIQHMIMNNLDPAVAQFPEELVTYGGNGQVFSNWAQFWLTMHYLSIMDENQTLVIYSGHPLGLFPSHGHAPRVVITNGMLIPNYSSKESYNKLFALGVTQYGQMTAGSYCYIGPQGIVHGTTIVVMNAGRKYLQSEDLSGKVFVTSGLGGMSGAQPKAAVIAGCICVVAEVCEAALRKRLEQGWLMECAKDLSDCIKRIREAKQTRRAVSIGYLGNVVDLWEALVNEAEKAGELLVDLGSDQSSCHNPFNGGYYPVQVSFEEANRLMSADPGKFKQLVQESLRRQISAIDKLTARGMRFWDYGNAFLLECQRAGADVKQPQDTTGTRFKYPSYVQDIMGDIFSLGFGPFRWVCTSTMSSDLQTSDEIARQTLQTLFDRKKKTASQHVLLQYSDNIKWISEAEKHKLVVGTQARILYADCDGRASIALALNKAIADGRIKAPIVISRDHHDVSGTDSPFRETSNIYDGSAFTADMAVQNCIGDSFRGATWVALHNGGGVGIGEAINGGFGLVLDGSQEAAKRAELMLKWDVMNGVARRCWSGNGFAKEALNDAMSQIPSLKVTVPVNVESDEFLRKLFNK